MSPPSQQARHEYKVIFLDIDGVWAPPRGARTLRRTPEHGVDVPAAPCGLGPHGLGCHTSKLGSLNDALVGWFLDAGGPAWRWGSK